MLRYKRILTAIDLGKRGEEVAHRALEIARTYDARLGVVHVLDHAPGLEDDHVPFLTPQEREAKWIALARERLDSLLERIGARGAETQVVAGHPLWALARLANEWGADLVVIGAHATHGLDRTHGHRPARTVGAPAYDVLVVQTEPQPALQRLLHSLLSPVLAWG
jgi:universal stress protein A